MAKKQYYISTLPRNPFPAFNPAQITIQASGYAVQAAQAIISSGIYPAGTNFVTGLALGWVGGTLDPDTGAVGPNDNYTVVTAAYQPIAPLAGKTATMDVSPYIKAVRNFSFSYAFYTASNAFISGGSATDRLTMTVPSNAASCKVSIYVLGYSYMVNHLGGIFMLYEGDGNPPYNLPPRDIVADYDPDNFTPPSIAVQPQSPNADMSPVQIGIPTGREGEYTADLSSVARYLFRNQRYTVPALREDATIPTVVDYDLVAFLSTSETGTFAAQNAVSQLGEQELFTEVRLLMESSPVQYPGYPLELVFYNRDFAATNQFLFGYARDKSGQDIGIAYTRFQPVVLFAVPEGTRSFYVNNLPVTLTTNIPIEEGCVSEYPFYIRWINPLGGYDFFMFNAKKTGKIDRANTEIVQFASPSDENQSQVAAWFTITRTLTTGAGGLSRKQYEALSHILVSPKVDWWNESTGKWVSVVVDNQSLTWDTESGFGSVSFTFVLPRTLLQL